MAESGSRESLLLVSPYTRYGGAVLLGLLASTVHWSGILIGGALVGLLAPSLRRGVVYGVGFGLLVWVTFVLELVTAGIVPTADALELFGLSFAIPVVLGGIGGTARELRPWIAAVTPWTDGSTRW